MLMPSSGSMTLLKVCNTSSTAIAPVWAPWARLFDARRPAPKSRLRRPRPNLRTPAFSYRFDRMAGLIYVIRLAAGTGMIETAATEAAVAKGERRGGQAGGCG